MIQTWFKNSSLHLILCFLILVSSFNVTYAGEKKKTEKKKDIRISSEVKSVGNKAIGVFRIYIQARGTKNFEDAEVARVKYIGYVEELYKFKGGREYLASRLKDYSLEVESSLDNLAKIVDEFEKASASNDYNKKVLANDMYNNALIDFTSKYGQPEAWLDSSCEESNPAKLLRNCKTKELMARKVDQWMLTEGDRVEHKQEIFEFKTD